MAGILQTASSDVLSREIVFAFWFKSPVYGFLLLRYGRLTFINLGKPILRKTIFVLIRDNGCQVMLLFTVCRWAIMWGLSKRYLFCIDAILGPSLVTHIVIIDYTIRNLVKDGEAYLMATGLLFSKMKSRVRYKILRNIDSFHSRENTILDQHNRKRQLLESME